MGARGTRGRAGPRRREATWRCFGGRVRMGARGARSRAGPRPREEPGGTAVGACERCPWYAVTCRAAAAAGHLEMLQWARQNGCPWNEETCWEAAGQGHLEMLQWARANGALGTSTRARKRRRRPPGGPPVGACERVPLERYTCSEAAQFGHLRVLQWAHQNGCPWDEETCSEAARFGHLGVLQWARENGCPWDVWTCAFAAEGGHLEVLKWAHQNGCPWSYTTWISASSRCRPYLIEHECPGAE